MTAKILRMSPIMRYFESYTDYLKYLVIEEGQSAEYIETLRQENKALRTMYSVRFWYSFLRGGSFEAWML